MLRKIQPGRNAQIVETSSGRVALEPANRPGYVRVWREAATWEISTWEVYPEILDIDATRRFGYRGKPDSSD